MKDLITQAEEHVWMGNTYRTVLPASATGGAMSIVDTTVPLHQGPPRHVHEREDEAFCVLEGQMEVWMEGETFTLSAGQSAFLPRGREHTFRVTGSGPCRKLLIITPAGFEEFFTEIARAGHRVPEDMGPLSECAARYGLRFTGPPLGA